MKWTFWDSCWSSMWWGQNDYSDDQMCLTFVGVNSCCLFFDYDMDVLGPLLVDHVMGPKMTTQMIKVV